MTFLASCTAESITGEQDKALLEIRVSVAAYNQGINDVSSSRASINSGVFTSFAPGDDLGLIVTDQNGNIVVNNYRYMVQKTGNAYRVDESGKVITSDVYFDENYSYFAYAPYNSKYNTGYTSIDSIIAQHKRDLKTLYTDQSKQAQYNAADLLVCKRPTREGTALRLTFTHAMSLMKIFYNGDSADLTVVHPAELSQMYKPAGSETYSYICPPAENEEVYGTALSKQTDEEGHEIVSYSYWQTKINLKENGALYISIYSQPTVSYKSAGVDMGFPSGCIWAKYNLGSESAAEFANRHGVWHDAAGELMDSIKNPNSELHSCFDRGNYYSWGELETKYEKPALLFDETTGRIKSTGDAIVVNSSGTQSVTALISGSEKGYYPDTYIDRSYSYASIDGNIAGTEYDVVRNKLWKGEWRIPNEKEVDELMRNSDITVAGWYFEDNVRYAPWLKDPVTGKYINLHPDNSEFFGTDSVRPYRYLVTIFKFTSTKNGEVLYIPGGTWSDWSIDMLACKSRSYHGLISSDSFTSDYGGMYYFASSASHDKIDCSSYMELETRLKFDSNGKITGVEPVIKKSYYKDKNGDTIELMGLTQNGHRYTGMLIRPVYGGKNWNTNTESRSDIRINVEQR